MAQFTPISVKVGELLKEEIGLPWLLTIVKDPSFLASLGTSSLSAWCMLWNEATTERGVLFYEMVTEAQDVAEQLGRLPDVFPAHVNDETYIFTSATEPDQCTTPKPLKETAPKPLDPRRLAAQARIKKQEEATAEAESDEEKEKKMGPGTIAVSAFFAALAVAGVYKWMTRVD